MTRLGRRALAMLGCCCFVLAGCGGTRSQDAESPRPTASLRGGVRGEIGEAEKSHAGRRSREQRLLDDAEKP